MAACCSVQCNMLCIIGQCQHICSCPWEAQECCYTSSHSRHQFGTLSHHCFVLFDEGGKGEWVR